MVLTACMLCGRKDDCIEKYGEKKNYKEENLTLHYYCLVSTQNMVIIIAWCVAFMLPYAHLALPLSSLLLWINQTCMS